MSAIKHFFWIGLLAGCLILFFVGGPDYYAPRSLKATWNLGHILFFSILPFYLFRVIKLPDSFVSHLLAVLLLSIVVGGAIELIQSRFIRSPDLGDLLRNGIGGLVYLFFLWPSSIRIPKKRLIFMKSVTIALIATQLVPVAITLTDEHLARKQFPSLSGFETPFELNRWSKKERIVFDKDVKMEGNASMRVQLTTETYSGVFLEYIPRDWSGYRWLQFSVYNPTNQEINLTCRVHDRQHTNGIQRYGDRFNRSFSFNKGWTTIRIPLTDIENAPSNRKMDMQRIYGLGIFATRLGAPKTIYIDNVRLTICHLPISYLVCRSIVTIGLCFILKQLVIR